MIWIVAHLADLVSDFSVFHRIGDIYALPGPTFFALAYRLPVYDGVTRLQLEKAVSSTENQAPPPQQLPEGDKVVPATRAALTLVPEFQGIFSFNKIEGGDESA